MKLHFGVLGGERAKLAFFVKIAFNKNRKTTKTANLMVHCTDDFVRANFGKKKTQT